MTTRSTSAALNEAAITALRAAIDAGHFPGIAFEDAMAFLLSDGVVPRDDLPVESIFALDDWATLHLLNRRDD